MTSCGKCSVLLILAPLCVRGISSIIFLFSYTCLFSNKNLTLCDWTWKYITCWKSIPWKMTVYFCSIYSINMTDTNHQQQHFQTWQITTEIISHTSDGLICVLELKNKTNAGTNISSSLFCDWKETSLRKSMRECSLRFVVSCNTGIRPLGLLIWSVLLYGGTTSFKRGSGHHSWRLSTNTWTWKEHQTLLLPFTEQKHLPASSILLFKFSTFKVQNIIPQRFPLVLQFQINVHLWLYGQLSFMRKPSF